MAYKKYYSKNFKRGGKTKTTPEANLEEDKPKNSGFPGPKNETVDLSFQRKAFKDMAFGSYSVPVNPQGEVSYEADPYAVVNNTNIVVDAAYAGSDNTAGSVVPQLANGSTSSFKDVTDIVLSELDINYCYCSTSNIKKADGTYTGNADPKVNKYMFHPYNDILETLIGEAYTDLSFFHWDVKCTEDAGETWGDDYTSPSGDGLLDLMMSYQATLQQVFLVPQAYRTIRSLEAHLKDMCYMDCSSKLNEMYGRLKKAAFINEIKTVAESGMYHYLDTNWWRQVNMLISVPCRKSNSMIDPLIVLEPRYKVNKELTVFDKDGNKLFDTDFLSTICTTAQSIVRKLSPYTLIRMARDSGTGYVTIQSWFNSIDDDVNTLIIYFDQFTKNFKEMLVAFKRMAKIGITEWKYGQFISVDHIDDHYTPKFNKLVYDIVRSMATGSQNITYDITLNQWKVNSLWDLFLGINTYDYKSGGSILTFSTHNSYKPSGTPSTVSYAALFEMKKGEAGSPTTMVRPFFLKCLTRSNFEYYISEDTLVLNSSREMTRLQPLTSYSSTTFKTPVIEMQAVKYQDGEATLINLYNAANNTPQKNVASWALFAMAKLFGYCRIITSRSGSAGHYTYTYEDNIETDALCFIDVVIDDQSNAIESFCRKHAPFRTVKADSVDKIGFAIKNTKGRE